MEFDAFVKDFNEVGKQVRAQYNSEEEGAPPVCHVLHRELDLPATPVEDVEEKVERAKAILTAQGLSKQAETVTEDDLDFTVDHAKLHAFIARFLNEARFQGIGADDIAMSLLIIGRRLGLREAAQAFGGLGDITGPEPDAPTV